MRKRAGASLRNKSVRLLLLESLLLNSTLHRFVLVPGQETVCVHNYNKIRLRWHLYKYCAAAPCSFGLSHTEIQSSAGE